MLVSSEGAIPLPVEYPLRDLLLLEVLHRLVQLGDLAVGEVSYLLRGVDTRKAADNLPRPNTYAPYLGEAVGDPLLAVDVRPCDPYYVTKLLFYHSTHLMSLVYINL